MLLFPPCSSWMLTAANIHVLFLVAGSPTHLIPIQLFGFALVVSVGVYRGSVFSRFAATAVTLVRLVAQGRAIPSLSPDQLDGLVKPDEVGRRMLRHCESIQW